jgi:hypothetical protein
MITLLRYLVFVILPSVLIPLIIALHIITHWHIMTHWEEV